MVCINVLCRFDHFFPAYALIEEAYVVENTPGKEEDILENNADFLSKALKVVIVDVPAIYLYLPRLNLVKPCEDTYY